MASSKTYLDYVLEQLSGVDGVTFRPMMGEYLLYCGGKLFGGIYDDRLLVKSVPAAVARMPDAAREIPYAGAKEMLLVDRVDDRAFLGELVPALCAQLPAPKPRRPRAKKL